MKYEVRCECGKTYPVGAADAGVSFRCVCGRTVDVPSLHVLRSSAGQHGVSPVVQLQALLQQGQLPGTLACACCGCETAHLIRVSVVCERVITKSSTGGAAGLVGCLLFGVLGGLVMSAASAKEGTQHGTDVSFTLPVRVCESCSRDLTAPAALRTALNATPAYAAVFDQYPNALVRRVS